MATATTPAEKERLQTIRLRFNIPPDSPEWQFYAVLAPIVQPGQADKTLAVMCAQLDRLEQRVDDLKAMKTAAPAAAVGRRPLDPTMLASVGLVVFALGVFACSAIAYVGGSILRVPASTVAIVAAFGLGVLVAAFVLGLRWLASIVRR